MAGFPSFQVCLRGAAFGVGCPLSTGGGEDSARPSHCPRAACSAVPLNDFPVSAVRCPRSKTQPGDTREGAREKKRERENREMKIDTQR